MAGKTDLETSLKRSRSLIIALATTTLILLIVVVALALGNRQSTTEAESVGGEPPTSEEAAFPLEEDTSETETEVSLPQSIGEEGAHVRRDPHDPMAVGMVDAPVVMSEWLDLKCPYCARFSNETLPQLIDLYVDPGLVRIEFHDVSFFGDQSTAGAVAARAAGEQGLYVEYLEAVYALSANGTAVDLTRDVLIEVAQTVGVADMGKFEADLDSEELEQAVLASTAQAQAIGVDAVPFFVIGTTSMSGAQPLENFEQFIDGAIAEASQ